MFHGFFFGILGGLVASKLVNRFRRGGACGGHGGGCGRSGWGPGRGFGGRFSFFRLIRELDLSPDQWRQGQDILRELRGTMQQGRDDLRGSVGPLLSVLATPEWSAAQAEEVAGKQDASFGRL